jgi:hypothetical protein
MRFPPTAKARLPVALLFAAALVLPGPAAGQIAYSGYTNGCFGGGCVVPNTSGFQFDQLVMPNSSLRFNNSTFSGTTTGPNDFFHLNAAPNGAFTQELNNLGAFYLTMNNTGGDVYNSLFTLAVTWTDPGSAQAVFSAVLTGNVMVGQGAPNRVVIDFTGFRQVFNWFDATTGLSGAIDLSLTDPVFVIAGGLGQTTSRNLVGEGHVTVAPEPISMILVGSGLRGVAGAARRRRRREEGDSVIA